MSDQVTVGSAGATPMDADHFAYVAREMHHQATPELVAKVNMQVILYAAEVMVHWPRLDKDEQTAARDTQGAADAPYA